ncbi:MAG: hypothetical protein U9N54_00910, partial [candidate division Zixibacteria bacterium]|nr:hypothetical protein [candidate division Zixibacteria bacterium]
MYNLQVDARDKKNINTNKAQAVSNFCVTQHDISNIILAVQNQGKIGFSYHDRLMLYTDCFTGKVIVPSCEFPKGSFLDNLQYVGLWVGGIKNSDTLVSIVTDGHPWGRSDEFFTDPSSDGTLRKKSIFDENSNQYKDLISEQDISFSYVDTLFRYHTFDDIDLRPHEPLYIKVTHNSYAWSYEYAQDFILFDLLIENIGNKRIDDVYLGMYMKSFFGYFEHAYAYATLSGFLENYPSNYGCKYKDTLNMAWLTHRDGIAVEGEYIDYVKRIGNFPYKSNRSVIGLKLLNNSDDNLKFSYNWWVRSVFDETSYENYYFGPQTKKNYRNFRSGYNGYPLGDRDMYFLLRNGEIDYDQAYTSQIETYDQVWVYDHNRAATNIISSAYVSLISTLQSIGPLTLTPGSSTNLSFALVCGENFHTDPNNINNLPHNPDKYMANVDFSDLAKNAMWASWIYDNPGIDTDGNGFYGKYRVCAIDSVKTESGWVTTKADTQFYEGDGVPDWRAAGPPPPPVFWLEPQNNSIKVCFNGERSETEKDFMTGIIDFEGYHIWIGRDDRETSLSVIASYDRYNFDKYVWNDNLLPEPNYQLKGNPLTLEQLRCLYGNGCDDSLFNPLDYIRHNPYIHPDFPDSIFIFLPHHHNTSEFGVTTPITKVYPNAVNPNSIHPDSLTDEHYTEDGYFKYYEYQFMVNNLLPTVPYYFNVTAFDQGSQKTGLSPLETSKTLDIQFTYPLSPGTSLIDDNRKVYIYPNPYIIDAGYRDKSYEGRNHDILPNDKVRAIHFNNLPAKCVIRIFSLDGDLVRQMTHDFDEADPNKLQHEWNLVSRNRQLVVSGIYYWS